MLIQCLTGADQLSKATFDEEALVSVTLDNYTKITCNAIFAITEATPETEFISEKFFNN